MRASSLKRLWTIPLIWLPAFAALWIYISTRDWAHSWRQITMGHDLTWPPRAKRGPKPEAIQTAEHTLATAVHVIEIVAAVLAALTLLVIISRARHRRRRMRAMDRWELRLGRDDLANPYHVQEAFEGIAGAIGLRWYERLWRGPEHLALEVHRVHEASIRFVIAAPHYLEAAISGPLEDLYPDVEQLGIDGQPEASSCVIRLKKRASFVLSIQTTRNYEHAFSESLVALMNKGAGDLSVQLVLTPASGFVHRRARKLLKRRERALQHADHRDPGELGIDSVVEAKELKGALELQHRTLFLFDLRVSGEDRASVRRVAGLFSQLRSENDLARREMGIRRGTYVRRIANAMPNPLPSLRTGVLSTSELATLWQLPRGRVKHGGLLRSTVRRASAPAGIDRDPSRALMRDEHGAVSIGPADRKFGHALNGGQGGGKSSVMARHFANDSRDPNRAVVLIDPKGPLAELCLGLAPSNRTVHYLDLGWPEIGVNPLTIDATPGTRAAVFLRALIEANPPGAIQAASDSFLRQAVFAVCTVEPAPTLWHVYRMLGVGESKYRARVVELLQDRTDAQFAKGVLDARVPSVGVGQGVRRTGAQPATQQDRATHLDPRDRHAATASRPAGHRGRARAWRCAHRLRRQSRRRRGQHDPRHPPAATAAPPGAAGAAEPPRLRATAGFALIDEAHNVLTPSVAKMLAEGRSAGLEAVFAWQYSAQIRDEVIRSGVRSLLQSISIFRMREIEDARSLAGLAMEVYSDRISIEQDEQERLRFSPDDILRLPVYQAINLWIANGTPRAGFVGHTLPMEPLHDPNLAEHHCEAQRAGGARHPDDLPDLLAQDEPAPRATSGEQQSKEPRPGPDPDGHQAEDPNGQQRFRDDFEGFEGRDA